MYFELRANDDTDHFAWLGNPDYDTGVADTILMELHPKGYLQKPLQPGFFQRIMDGSTFNSGTMTGGTNQFNTGNHYNTSSSIGECHIRQTKLVMYIQEKMVLVIK